MVKQVQEVYGDFYTINDDLFSLQVPSVMSLQKPAIHWSEIDKSIVSRILDGT